MREAEGRLGPGNLEGEARKYAGPYPRAAKGECAGETGEGGAKMQDDRGGRAAHRRPEGLEWRAHEAKRSAQPRNTAQASAQGGAKMRNDHCELWNAVSVSRLRGVNPSVAAAPRHLPLVPKGGF